MYSYLTVGVDLGPDGGVLVQVILAADGEGGAAAHGAGPGNAGLQGGAGKHRHHKPDNKCY